jgi:hypothetical protein
VHDPRRQQQSTRDIRPVQCISSVALPFPRAFPLALPFARCFSLCARSPSVPNNTPRCRSNSHAFARVSCPCAAAASTKAVTLPSFTLLAPGLACAFVCAPACFACDTALRPARDVGCVRARGALGRVPESTSIVLAAKTAAALPITRPPVCSAAPCYSNMIALLTLLHIYAAVLLECVFFSYTFTDIHILTSDAASSVAIDITGRCVQGYQHVVMRASAHRLSRFCHGRARCGWENQLQFMPLTRHASTLCSPSESSLLISPTFAVRRFPYGPLPTDLRVPLPTILNTQQQRLLSSFVRVFGPVSLRVSSVLVRLVCASRQPPARVSRSPRVGLSLWHVFSSLVPRRARRSRSSSVFSFAPRAAHRLRRPLRCSPPAGRCIWHVCFSSVPPAGHSFRPVRFVCSIAFALFVPASHRVSRCDTSSSPTYRDRAKPRYGSTSQIIRTTSNFAFC